MKYRKKPVVIESFKWTGDVAALESHAWMIEAVLNHVVKLVPNPPKSKGLDALYIKTLEGEMEASYGDYIIKEPFPTDDRTVYPCKPDIFEQTYEKVEE